MRVGRILGVAVGAALAAAPVAAGPVAGPERPDPERVDPFLRDGAPSHPAPFAPDLREDGDRAAVLVLDPGDSAAVETLQEAGLRFRTRADGSLVEVGGVHPVDAPLDLLRHLAAEGWNLRLARPVDAHPPTTGVTGPLSELDALVAAGPSPVDGPTGAGLTVADVDSSIDVLHPHFFRADGGVAIWFDADRDGVLTPGIDGIDRDGDGVLDDTEILRLANGRRMWTEVGSYADVVDGDDELLDPARDWLWLDENDNGVRDAGPLLGFDEDDPGYAERTYVPDDLDGDGVIAVPERLLRLGSSRIVAVTRGYNTWRRGEDLIEVSLLPTWRLDHGTGVGGILVGGQLHPQPRPQGFLPEADLYLYDRYTSNSADELEVLDQLAAEGVDVILWEYGQWVTEHLDGSSPVELAIDALSDAGIPQICPAGNLGTSGKHGESVSDEDGRFTFHARMSSWVADVIPYLWIDLHTDNVGVEVACELTDPEGAVWDVAFDGEDGAIGDLDTWSFTWASPRDTTLWTLTLSGELTAGTWVLRCGHDGAGGRLFHAYLNDGFSWSRGAYWLQEQDRSNLTLPSTADSCVSVAAFAGSRTYWDGEEVGERHLYSGMGPRIDGGKTIDVAAPADPFVPVPGAEVEFGFTHPAYDYFSGTSGAGPHVAAAAVLLKELEPDADGEAVRQLLREGARTDAVVDADALAGYPDDAWGYGKLSAYRSAFGEAPAPPPQAPGVVAVELDAVDDGDGRCLATATGVADGVPDATFRWDVDYDGEWDTGFEGAPHEFDVAPGEVKVVRVQAAAGGWWIGGTSLIWQADDPCPAPGACRDCAASVGGSAYPALGLAVLLLATRRRRTAIRSTAVSA